MNSFSTHLTWKNAFFAWLVLQIFGLVMSTIELLDRFQAFDNFLNIFFFIYVTIIILGVITTFRLLKFYDDFGSSEFLIMAFGVLGFSTNFFLYQIYADFLFDIPFANVILQEPWLHLFGLPYVYLGYYSMLYIAIRSRPWESYSRAGKVLIIVAVYENATKLLTIYEQGIVGFLIKGENPFFYVGIFQQMSLVTIIFSPDFPIFLNDLFIWIPIIYIFSTMEVTKYTRETRIAKIVWISIGILMVTVRLSADFIQVVIYDITDTVGYTIAYSMWAVGTLIMVTIIAITLSLMPEALLLSKQQLFRANKLYLYVQEPPENMESYKSRIYNYIQELPEEIKIKIQKQKNRN